jgi:hypothetical protein
MEIGMPSEGSSDLHIITEADQLSAIRRLFGPKMSGPKLLTDMTRDLTLVGAFPIYIDRVGGWWLISSSKDWLLQPDGSVSMRSFRNIVRFPDAGLEACHGEILLTTFADAVVTRGAGGELTWITGEARWPIPADVLHRLHGSPGRVIAFMSTDDEPIN